MAEVHLVYIKREIPDPYDMYCPHKEIEIEVTVEVVRGHPGDYWTQPDDDQAEVIDCSHTLTDSEVESACDLAIAQPTPEPEMCSGDDDIKPF